MRTNHMPSLVEDITKSDNDRGMDSPGGSVELRRHHEGNIMKYAECVK